MLLLMCVFSIHMKPGTADLDQNVLGDLFVFVPSYLWSGLCFIHTIRSTLYRVQLSFQQHGPLIPERLTCIFFCGITNKTVQIPMVGLNIESTVSFPHNSLHSKTGTAHRDDTVTASWIHSKQFIAIICVLSI